MESRPFFFLLLLSYVVAALGVAGSWRSPNFGCEHGLLSREEAVRTEETLKAAQECLHAANGRLAKVPAFVEVHEDHIVVNVKTRDTTTSSY
jgi:hypothetical protein